MRRTGRTKATEGFWARANDMLSAGGRHSAEGPTSDYWQSVQARWPQSRPNKQRLPHLPPGDVQGSVKLKTGVCERSTRERSSSWEHLEGKGDHWWTRKTSRGRGLGGSPRVCLSTLEKCLRDTTSVETASRWLDAGVWRARKGTLEMTVLRTMCSRGSLHGPGVEG